jgi:phosphate transport system permease protein
MRWGATAAAMVAVAVLVLVIGTVVAKGAGALSFAFLTQNAPALYGATNGGIGNAILGSAVLIAAATAIALPIGTLIALFMTEFATPALARPIRLTLDLLVGLPSVVIGMFIYALIVIGGGESGFAGSLALAIIMLPLIARTTQEMFLLVPQALRDASHALGVSRWRTIFGVVVPSAFGGILTGTVLAIARAAGESAPLILVCGLFNPQQTTFNFFGQPFPSIPGSIFNLVESSFPGDHTKAWGAALVLMTLILVGNLVARTMLARQRRMMMSR